MKVALWSGALAYFQKSMTHAQQPPASFEYVKAGDPEADILMATGEDERWAVRLMQEAADDPRPKILWMQEARWIMDGNAYPEGWNLVLTADEDKMPALRRLGPVEFMPFVGTWLKEPLDMTKEYDVSMVASDKAVPGVEGYYVRREIAARLGRYWEHGYGPLFNRPIEDKAEGLAPYRFSIAVESQRYAWNHTEKLFDCFAAKCIPIYWGPNDYSKLEALGFDWTGVLFVKSADEAVNAAQTLASPEMYEYYARQVEHNYRRAHELYCTEVVLEQVLREKLCLVSAS